MATFMGTDGRDTLSDNPGDNSNDLILGLLDADQIMGQTGDDTLRGGWGNDLLSGGDGDDWLDGGPDGDSLYGDRGQDTLMGGLGDDLLVASDGAHALYGGAGADRLFAYSGERVTLSGGAGNDDILSGANTATFLVGRSDGTDEITLTQGQAFLQLTEGLTPLDLIVAWVPPEYQRKDTAPPDDLVTVRVRGGNTTLRIHGAMAHLVGVNWGAAAGMPLMSLLNLSQQGTAGDDQLTALSTNMELRGGEGNDTLWASIMSSTWWGRNAQNGEGGDDVLNGNPYTPSDLIGGQGCDTLIGGMSDDVLQGGWGDDLMRGGLGADLYIVDGAPGRDTIDDADWQATAEMPGQGASGARIELRGIGAPGDLRPWRDGSDLILTHVARPDFELRVKHYFDLPDTRNVFNTGEVYDPLLTPRVDRSDGLMRQGTAGADGMRLDWGTGQWLSGGQGDDTLDAGHGSGTLVGDEGHDTYLWGLDSGDVTIRAGSNFSDSGWPEDLVALGMGISPDQLKVDAVVIDRTVAWRLSLPDHLATLTLMSSGNYPLDRIPGLRFDSGQFWGPNQIMDMFLRQRPDVIAWLQGRPELFTTGQGPQGIAYGGGGPDTFEWHRLNNLRGIAGATTPYLDDAALGLLFGPRLSGDTDVLNITGGIRPQDIEVSVRSRQDGQPITWGLWSYVPGAPPQLPADGDVVLRDRLTDRELVLRDYLADVRRGTSEADAIVFDDGTRWTPDDLLALAVPAGYTGTFLRGGMLGNTLSGEDGHDRLFGDAGNDLLTGESGDDTLIGGDGRDTLDGGSGMDLLMGGAGDDTYVIDHLGDRVIEENGQGRDRVRSSTFDLYGIPDIEILQLAGELPLQAHGAMQSRTTLVGNDADNLLTGGDLGDALIGGWGHDTLIGGAGSDYYTLIDDADTLIEREGDSGIDVILSVTEHVTMADHIEVVFLKTDSALAATGNDQDNTMYGRASGAIFHGRGGDDLLLGDRGDDWLDGGLGDDTLQGDGGDDVYTYALGDGNDTVIDRAQAGDLGDLLNMLNIRADQLWFKQAGLDLYVRVLGTNGGVTLQDWFAGADRQIERITAGAQYLDASKVPALLQAMSGVAPPSSSTQSLPAAQRNAIQAAWSLA